MSKFLHMCISVRGMLNWKASETRKWLPFIKKNDGNKYQNVAEFRDALMDELSKGHEVIPMGPLCEGFDYMTGCPGHEEKP